MDTKPFLNLAPQQRLIMTLALRQSLEILQMTQQELAQWLYDEIEKNPLLELGATRSTPPLSTEIAAPENLFEYLQSQIREHFNEQPQMQIAQLLFQHLDEKGFLTTPLETLFGSQNPLAERVLAILQTFDPPGIFARNLQEALLLQLRAKGKKSSPAIPLIEKCYEDLLHGRFSSIKKKLGTLDLQGALSDLASLSLRPTQSFQSHVAVPIYPDLHIKKVEKGWTLELKEELLPQFHIQSEYLALTPESREECESLRTFKTGAKWLFRSLERRRKLLKDIGKLILYKQALFLDQKGPLAPFSMKEAAQKLQIHESTLSRALAGKYAFTPRGILPLRSLITAHPAAENARKALQKLIEEEDKSFPLTDEQLAQLLTNKGYPFSRRTIAKYRAQLKIAPAPKRKR